MNYDASYHIPISLALILYMNLDLYCTPGADPENYVSGGQKFLFEFFFLFSHRQEKTCLRGSANNAGTDQPAHLLSLISAFFIHYLESIICKLATGEITIF